MTIRRFISVFLPACLLISVIWFGILIGLTYKFEPVPEAVIIGPERALMSAIQKTDVRVVGGSAPYMSVIGDRPGFVRDLYKNGAWLVLPGSVSGCIDPKNWISVERRRLKVNQ